MNTYTMNMAMTSEDRDELAKILNNAKTALLYIKPLIITEDINIVYDDAEQLLAMSIFAGDVEANYRVAEHKLADICNYLTSDAEISGYGIMTLNSSIISVKRYLNVISDHLFKIGNEYAEKFMFETGPICPVPFK